MATVAQRLQAERLRFPALLPDEQIVFRNWLRLHEKEFDAIEGNVRIGEGADPGPTFSEAVRKSAIAITQLRVDVLAWRNAQPTIIEVKRRASPSNVGQLLTYKAVWEKERRSAAPPKLLLICVDYTPNILPVLRETGIQLEIVKADFSELRTPPRASPGPSSS